jgi:hypothetical protein
LEILARYLVFSRAFSARTREYRVQLVSESSSLGRDKRGIEKQSLYLSLGAEFGKSWLDLVLVGDGKNHWDDNDAKGIYPPW